MRTVLSDPEDLALGLGMKSSSDESLSVDPSFSPSSSVVLSEGGHFFWKLKFTLLFDFLLVQRVL